MNRILIAIILFSLVSCGSKNDSADSIPKSVSELSKTSSTGDWQIGNFVDGFGDPTGKNYPHIKGTGQITVYVVEKRQNVMCFVFNSLSEPYDKDPYFWLQYKVSDGTISEWLKLPRSYGNGYAILGEGTDDLIKRIRNGEKIKFQGFSADNPNSVCFKGIKDTNFAFDFAHYEEATSKVNWNGIPYNLDDYK